MIRIYVDDREKSSGIPDILKDYGVTVIIQQLTVGDYVITDKVAIERKSVNDLVNSVFDKRLFDQIDRLSSVYEEPVLLVEGNIEKIHEITDKWKAVMAALISVMVDYNLKVIYSANKRDSAYLIFKIAEKYQLSDIKRSRIILHNKPKFENIRDIQLYFIESLPNIGEATAKKLLESFSTIKNICNASISDLERAIGSRKKAEDIYRIFNTPYSVSSDSTEKKSLLDYF